jgi:metal-responsive CopG/Arc/MetJ family transcriptional regulator
MAKKVTISIPDMLHEKLEKWRESFNLSKMFQEAVSEAIQRKEDFQKRIREDLDLGQIIDRLRREKLQSEGNYLETGKKDGILWAKSAHYDHLRYALAWSDFDSATRDSILGPYFSEVFAANRLGGDDTYSRSEYLKNYICGWKQGIEFFWHEIKERL